MVYFMRLVSQTYNYTHKNRDLFYDPFLVTFIPPQKKTQARIEAGFLLRKLQCGEKVTRPFSRPMQLLGSVAMNYEYKIRIKHGGLYIE